MNENEIFEKIKKVTVDQLGVNEDLITMQTTFVDDLAADSLDIVELVMELEEEFGIDIPDEETEKIACVGDVVRYIKDQQ